MKPHIQVKRVYDKPSEKDGYRVLADRIWPRGISKEDAQLDEWPRELAPSAELRKWFGHDPALWPEFKHRYLAELKDNKAATDFIADHRDKKVITLLYAAKDEAHNNAIVLQHYLEQHFTAS